MRLVIDEANCLKHKLTPEEVLIALAVRSSKDFKGTLDNLVKREVLVIKGGKYLITQRWEDEIDEVLLDSMGHTHSDEGLLKLAEQMRGCYPEGRMPNSPYYYRSNRNEVMHQLKKFFEVHGNYPDEEIIEATKRFVASFNGDYHFLPMLKYFITKNKVVTDEEGDNHISEYSPLADFLENKEDNAALTPDDWLVNMRV